MEKVYGRNVSTYVEEMEQISVVLKVIVYIALCAGVSLLVVHTHCVLHCVGFASINCIRKLEELSNFDVENVHIFGLLECKVLVVWAFDEHVLNNVCHVLCI